MIGPITITFDTTAATEALQRLAQAAIERPDLAKGIGQLSNRLFECSADYDNFIGPSPHEIKIEIYPSETFRTFLKALKILDGNPPQVMPPFDELKK